MQIITVTMNPAIDKSSRVDRVLADRKLRCQLPSFEPGGGGINVSRAIRNLDGHSMCFYPVGGASGQLFQELLEAEKLPHLGIPVNPQTRENLMIYEESTGRQFRFGMPGGELTQKEWQNCLDKIFQFDVKPEFIVGSGSLPPGLPVDFYGRMATRCKKQGIHFIVDTSGKALSHALDEGVFLAKPNLKEFTSLTEHNLDDESDQEAFAQSLIQEKKSRYLVISLGAAGVLAASEDLMERLRAPTVNIKSKVGAGDSTLAGITLKLSQSYDFIDAVKYGVAAGAAAVMTPGTELCRRSDVETLVQKIA